MNDYSVKGLLDRIGEYIQSASDPFIFRNGVYERGLAEQSTNAEKYINPIVGQNLSVKPPIKDRFGDQYIERRPPTYTYTDKEDLPSVYIPLVENVARKYELNPSVLASLLAQETGGYNYQPIPSSAGARGMSQIMPKWHYGEVGFNNPEEYGTALDTNPDFAVDEAGRILSDYLKQAEMDYIDALSAYNAGFGNLEAGRGYAEEVLRRANAID